ncbi:hypothetical protein J3Q09_26000 [Pseudomonas sp. R4-83]|uniref:hypothetical protein n=1 Tax=unclassified Pseudomonas TaxID=196821 RepID=UPI003DA9048E
MQLHEAKAVYEAESYAEANEKFAEGWKLLAVLTTTRHGGDQAVSYILGHPGKKPDPLAGGFGQHVTG